jgi:N6-adenosine-specific RNA methylase IME4
VLIESGPFQGLVRNGYRAILADPAWKFAVRSNKGMGRSPDNHYSTMTLDDIKALPVADLADKHAVLFLCVIDTHLPMALEVITAWGFSYKTVGFYWAKTNRDDSPFTGMGYWTRANPEQVFMGVGHDVPSQWFLAAQGSPRRDQKDVKRLIMSRRREHSRKPDELHESIERLVPGPYVELFARESRPGWHSWGNEKRKFDLGRVRPFDDLLGASAPAQLIPHGLFEDLLG